MRTDVPLPRAPVREPGLSATDQNRWHDRMWMGRRSGAGAPFALIVLGLVSAAGVALVCHCRGRFHMRSRTPCQIPPADVSLLLDLVQQGIRDVGVARRLGCTPQLCRLAIDILSWQLLSTRLPALLPTGTKVAHKTGTAARTFNDAGIIFRNRPWSSSRCTRDASPGSSLMGPLARRRPGLTSRASAGPAGMPSAQSAWASRAEGSRDSLAAGERAKAPGVDQRRGPVSPH